MEALISNRCNRKILVERMHLQAGIITHLTANLGLIELLDWHGSMSLDRMVKMIDFIDPEGESRQ